MNIRIAKECGSKTQHYTYYVIVIIDILNMAFKMLCGLTLTLQFLSNIFVHGYHISPIKRRIPNLNSTSTSSSKFELDHYTMTDKTYVFSGKVLKSFHLPSHLRFNDLKPNYTSPEDSSKIASDVASVIKILRVFKGNVKAFHPFKKVIVIHRNPLICRPQDRHTVPLNRKRCKLLVFGKLIFSAVFEADLILKEKDLMRGTTHTSRNNVRSLQYKRSYKGKFRYVFYLATTIFY